MSSAIRLHEDGLGIVSKSTGTHWVPVIGLEVHCQLATRTKLFCGCEAVFGAPPNSHTCPVCTGQPGALPVLNAEAHALAIRAALALDCDIAPRSRFDRKNYFYCDLPKGYQISQLDEPFCTGGGIRLANGHFVRLHRIHLEEDAGKATHDRGEHTLVDLNRAGVPLIESVTEADLRSSDEAYEYLTALKEVLQYAAGSDCDMEKGSLRCDVNISVHPVGEPWRTKVEIKNLNSFRNVRASIEYEIERQVLAWESADASAHPVQETRLFDADRGVTRPMRRKEGEADYRYFPEPDLPSVTVDAVFLERQRSLLPELPAARRARYVAELGLSEYDAGVLVSTRAVADFFEVAARLSKKPKDVANWISNEVLRGLSDVSIRAAVIDDLPIRPHDLAELVGLIDEGRLSSAGAKTVLRDMMVEGRSAKDTMIALEQEQVSDPGQVEEWCRAALVGREAIVAEIRAGKEKAIGALVGAVMQASKGQADPQRVQETLRRLIAQG